VVLDSKGTASDSKPFKGLLPVTVSRSKIYNFRHLTRPLSPLTRIKVTSATTTTGHAALKCYGVLYCIQVFWCFNYTYHLTPKQQADYLASRWCSELECKKRAQGPTGKCFAHEGGVTCSELECKKRPQGPTGKCFAHGGGLTCSVLECAKQARGGSGKCCAHGDGKKKDKQTCEAPSEEESDAAFCDVHPGFAQSFPGAPAGAGPPGLGASGAGPFFFSGYPHGGFPPSGGGFAAASAGHSAPTRAGAGDPAVRGMGKAGAKAAGGSGIGGGLSAAMPSPSTALRFDGPSSSSASSPPAHSTAALGFRGGGAPGGGFPGFCGGGYLGCRFALLRRYYKIKRKTCLRYLAYTKVLS